MTARERVLTIRLMDRIAEHPSYAEALGIEATGVMNNQIEKTGPGGLPEYVRLSLCKF